MLFLHHIIVNCSQKGDGERSDGLGKYSTRKATHHFESMSESQSMKQRKIER